MSWRFRLRVALSVLSGDRRYVDLYMLPPEERA